MRRGGLYRVARPPGDPREQRVLVVVSRQTVIASQFSTLICAPVYTRRDGLATQVDVGIDNGLKHDSSIHCDGLVSIERTRLTSYVGQLDGRQMVQLNRALAIALGLDED